MVGHFVRLKLKLVRNRLGRSSAWGVVGFVLVWMTALGAAIGGAALMVAGGRLLEPPDAIPTLVFTAVSLGWIIGPVLAASFDDMLDPRRFELLPLSRTELGIGLTAAGLIGPGGVATAIGILLGTIGGFSGFASFVPIAAAAVLEILLSVVTARFVLAALADVLRARRAREILGVVVALMAAIPGIFSGLINTGAIRVDANVEQVADWAAWLPPGALGRSVVAFANGDWLLGLGGLSYGAAALAAVTLGYGWALNRLQVVADSGAEIKRVKATGMVLRPVRLHLPAGPVGAVAAKEFVYLRRDSRLRGQMIGSVVGLAAIVTVGVAAVEARYTPFLAVAMAFFLVQALLVNQFGYDKGAFWSYLVAAGSIKDVLKGKNLAGGLVAGAVSLLTAFVAAAVAGDFTYLPAAGLSSLVMVAIWAAVGNATSVLAPIPLAEGTGFTSGSLSGSAFVASMGGMAVAGILLLPAVLGVGLTVWRGAPVWATVASVIAGAYAAFVYWISLRWTGPMAERRVLQILEVVDRD